jgi:hypothetical protein
MSAQHTPGPWVADMHFATRNGGRTWVPVLRPGNDPVPIAVVHVSVDGYGREESEANARLIAAAPDLLAALHGMIGLVQLIVPTLPKEQREAVEGNHRLVDARAALAKVEGGAG